jgi:hypothetical protein
MMKTTDYKPKNPQWALAHFFDCWKRRAWKQILEYVQLSWIARHKDPSKVLRTSLHTLVNAEDMQIIFHKKRSAHILLVRIQRKSNTAIDQSQQKVKLFYEDNKWRVDPESIV